MGFARAIARSRSRKRYRRASYASRRYTTRAIQRYHKAMTHQKVFGLTADKEAMIAVGTLTNANGGNSYYQHEINWASAPDVPAGTLTTTSTKLRPQWFQWKIFGHSVASASISDMWVRVMVVMAPYKVHGLSGFTIDDMLMVPTTGGLPVGNMSYAVAPFRSEAETDIVNPEEFVPSYKVVYDRRKKVGQVSRESKASHSFEFNINLKRYQLRSFDTTINDDGNAERQMWLFIITGRADGDVFEKTAAADQYSITSHFRFNGKYTLQ